MMLNPASGEAEVWAAQGNSNRNFHDPQKSNEPGHSDPILVDKAQNMTGPKSEVCGAKSSGSISGKCLEFWRLSV